jgi:fumarate reductase subunit C
LTEAINNLTMRRGAQSCHTRTAEQLAGGVVVIIVVVTLFVMLLYMSTVYTISFGNLNQFLKAGD